MLKVIKERLKKRIHRIIRSALTEELIYLNDRLNALENLFIERIEVTERSLHHHLHNIKQAANLIARNQSFFGNKKKIKVLFLIHHIEAFDALVDVFRAMSESENFQPYVASIPRRFPGSNIFKDEELVHQGLEKLGVPHMRFSMEDSFIALDVVKAIAPDIIFRQSPWEQDVPPGFHTAELTFAKLCYVPYYGSAIVEKFNLNQNGEDLHIDQYFHRMCWKIFAETHWHKEYYKKRSVRGGDNIVVTGHPKLDRLYKIKEQGGEFWPINQGSKNYRIIWAPHHSIGNDWLNFGTFHEVYIDMLNWVSSDKEIEVVLKPHPALFDTVVEMSKLTKEELNKFKHQWGSLSNTAIYESGNYGPLFKASDALITDGVSFLVEYQIFDKPLLFIDSGRHVPFNEFGKSVMQGAYVVKNIEETKKLIDNLKKSGNDPLIINRSKVKNLILPYPGESVKRILDSIVENI